MRKCIYAMTTGRYLKNKETTLIYTSWHTCRHTRQKGKDIAFRIYTAVALLIALIMSIMSIMSLTKDIIHFDEGNVFISVKFEPSFLRRQFLFCYTIVAISECHLSKYNILPRLGIEEIRFVLLYSWVRKQKRKRKCNLVFIKGNDFFLILLLPDTSYIYLSRHLEAP